ncbi:prolipoprotein diacylglyceryl transferase [Tenacibaculum skagerrakense]|uniref:Phosphatidylglycerol--prolipoprotein diacylglyceryl transferase n=1 Tax=Tenacibaculum skagerrakense TaxID=186571 RepID=A0A4R2NM35_9FLAO|nr:prolipoprotein diacylglyceryl transferase [Tenacibaculum skagerrakense]TCP22611.1 prolipoprotein diacylglyceryl transferase [Tenacibaculum skagerrakense]
MSYLAIKWDLDPEIFNIGGFSIRYYSVMFIIAFVLGLHLMKKIFTEDNISHEKMDPLFMYTFVSMLIGMRLGEVFFYSWADYQDNLLQIILPFRRQEGAEMLFGLVKGWKFTGISGFASHGAAIAIPIALYFYAKKHLQKSWLFILDRMGIMVALAGFFIRMGNFFNSEIYGKPTGSSFGVIFTRAGEKYPCHPTQIYEAVSYLILFFILWRLYWKTDKKQKEGYLFGVFMIALWSLRFVIEFIKKPQVQERGEWALNTGQWLSIPLILIGVWLMFRKTASEKS